MKQVIGMVVSNKMQKSVVVAVDRLFHHKVYNRFVKRTSKFMAHDEHNLCNIGDRVSNLNLSIVGLIFQSISVLLNIYSKQLIGILFFARKVNDAVDFTMF